MSKIIQVVEVGPRDGFQMESKFIPTELKVAVLNEISASGIRKIEATSFVHPKIIPQMADAEDVMQRIRRAPGVIYGGLVANLRGALRALEAGVDMIRVVVCVTESYNQKNAGMSVAASLAVSAEVLEIAKSRQIPTEIAIGLAFGCPLEGAVPENKLLKVIEKAVCAGFREVSLADSVGVANPASIRRTIKRVIRDFPETHFSLHLHNTRGRGLANAVAGLDEGLDTFDASIGGLGGCPVVPGGSGNIATEDLLNMLVEMGFTTGVDIERVAAASRMMAGFLERQLASFVLSAGTTSQLFRKAAARTKGTVAP